MGYTPNQHYYLPVPNEQGFGPAVNENFEKIDTAITALQSATNPHAYVPTGGQIVWSSRIIPSGWLLCDGRVVSRSEYADLFAVIGTLYGIGDGSTTFHLPNKVGKFVVGADATNTRPEYAVGATGGSETVKLAASEMPVHNHGGSSGSAGGHTHSLTLDAAGTHSHAVTVYKQMSNASGSNGWEPSGSGGSSGTVGAGCSEAGSHTHAPHLGSVSDHVHAVSANGGDGAHENRPPFVAEFWIIKT